MEFTLKLLVTPRTVLTTIFLTTVVAVSGALAVRFFGSTSLLPVLPAVFGAVIGGLTSSFTWRRQLNRTAENDEATDPATPERRLR